jgi:hypothetical protein
VFRRQQRVPVACVDPAGELGGHRPPGAVALQQVAPVGVQRVQPEHPNEEPLLLQPRPLLVGEFVLVSHSSSI